MQYTVLSLCTTHINEEHAVGLAAGAHQVICVGGVEWEPSQHPPAGHTHVLAQAGNHDTRQQLVGDL